MIKNFQRNFKMIKTFKMIKIKKINKLVLFH